MISNPEVVYLNAPCVKSDIVYRWILGSDYFSVSVRTLINVHMVYHTFVGVLSFLEGVYVPPSKSSGHMDLVLFTRLLTIHCSSFYPPFQSSASWHVLFRPSNLEWLHHCGNLLEGIFSIYYTKVSKIL